MGHPAWMETAVPESGISPEERRAALELLSCAHEAMCSVASPLLSGFVVGAACMSPAAEVGVGANLEWGGGPNSATDSATHAEESAVANLLLKGGRDARLAIIAMTSNSDNEFTCSCGRCRGVLQTYAAAGTDPLVVSARRDGHYVAWRLSALLPEPCIARDLSPADTMLVASAQRAAAHSWAPLTSATEGECGAAIRCTDGSVLHGARFNLASYYGSSALQSAIAVLSSGERRVPEAVAVCSAPGVLRGEDRQRLYECADYFGVTETLRVLLVSGDGSVSLSTPAELLPSAYSMAALAQGSHK